MKQLRNNHFEIYLPLFCLKRKNYICVGVAGFRILMVELAVKKEWNFSSILFFSLHILNAGILVQGKIWSRTDLEIFMVFHSLSVDHMFSLNSKSTMNDDGGLESHKTQVQSQWRRNQQWMEMCVCVFRAAKKKPINKVSLQDLVCEQ